MQGLFRTGNDVVFIEIYYDVTLKNSFLLINSSFLTYLGF